MTEEDGAREGEVTALLHEWRGGNRAALDLLLPIVYAELRRLAAQHLRRERSGHTLQPTAVVHEAYLRLMGQKRVDWQSRAHFFGVASQMMRRVLVDHAKARATAKRGGDRTRLELESADSPVGPRGVDLLALDEALERLGALDPGQVRVVELRYFGGLTVEETAEVVGVSTATVKRDWHAARAWLLRELGGART